MTYGVTPTGFVAKPFEQIKTEFEADLRTTFGDGINLTPESNFGQLTGIVCEGVAELWELGEAVYAALTPDGASDVPLDDVAALTGTAREAPEYTRVHVTVTGAPGTVLPAGRRISVQSTNVVFETVPDVTIGAGGTTSGVECRAVEAGPFVAPAGTLVVIETPVAGWDLAANPEDQFALGALLENDAALRVRREIELRAQGNAALEPIRQAVLRVEDVLSCTVFENDTDSVNSDGMPPHSIEVLVQGGDPAAVASAILASKAAGVRPYGALSEVVLDAEVNAHTIGFTRPTLLPVYVRADVTRIPDEFPADGAVQIRDAIVSYGDAKLRNGADVVASALSAQVFKVSGVDEVTALYISLAPNPTSAARIPVGARQLAALDSSRVTVNLV